LNPGAGVSNSTTVSVNPGTASDSGIGSDTISRIDEAGGIVGATEPVVVPVEADVVTVEDVASMSAKVVEAALSMSTGDRRR